MIITRFAPNPSGYLHIGNIRIMLYSWIFAQKKLGKFILRIEDTNKNKFNKFFKKNIIKDIKWIGINWNDKIILQSNRINKYNKIINELLEAKLVYPCFCSKKRIFKLKNYQIKNNFKTKYDKFCKNKNFSSYDLINKKHVIRFKNPINTYTYLQDVIYGNLKFNNNELDDFIIRRENKLPTYNFCVVMDDIFYKITHIIRGSDHISNTPKQINLINCMNVKIPTYIHIPIMLDENKNKISKSKNCKNLKIFKKEGILPYSIKHYLLTIGNSNFDFIYKNILTKKEMIDNFEINKINKSPIIFDNKKLLWINKNYLEKLPNTKIFKIFKKYINIYKLDIKNKSFFFIKKFLISLKNRSYSLQNLIKDNDFLFKNLKINVNYLIKLNLLNINYNLYLENIINDIYKIKKWEIFYINKIIYKNINIYNKLIKNNLYKIIGMLLSSKINSPNISIIMYIIGKKKSIDRLNMYKIIIKSYQYL